MTVSNLKCALGKVTGVSSVVSLSKCGKYSYLTGLYIDCDNKHLYLYCSDSDDDEYYYKSNERKTIYNDRLWAIIGNVSGYFDILVSHRIARTGEFVAVNLLKDVQFHFEDDVVVLVEQWDSADEDNSDDYDDYDD